MFTSIELTLQYRVLCFRAQRQTARFRQRMFYYCYSPSTCKAGCYGLSLVTPWQVGEAVPLDASRDDWHRERSKTEAEELLGVVET